MALTNAQRQRRYVMRLKALATAGDRPSDPGESGRSIEDAHRVSEALLDVEYSSERIFDRLTHKTFGSHPDQRLDLLRLTIDLVRHAGPSFLKAAQGRLREMEEEFDARKEQQKLRKTKKRGQSSP